MNRNFNFKKKVSDAIKSTKINNSKKDFPIVSFDNYNNTLEILFSNESYTGQYIPGLRGDSAIYKNKKNGKVVGLFITGKKIIDKIKQEIKGDKVNMNKKIFKIDDGNINCYAISNNKKDLLESEDVKNYFIDTNDLKELEIIKIDYNKKITMNFDDNKKITLSADEWTTVYEYMNNEILAQSEV